MDRHGVWASRCVQRLSEGRYIFKMSLHLRLMRGVNRPLSADEWSMAILQTLLRPYLSVDGLLRRESAAASTDANKAGSSRKGP